MKKLFNVSAKLKSEKGVTLVYVALLLVVFLGMAALAVDVGYLMVSKNELQNAADAAALAGASYLYPQISARLSFSSCLGHGNDTGNQRHRTQ